ncbi:MAG: SDR family oxidoreductase [Rhodospirillales bacterium]|nr:SDR family oxidoreductase [Rhodospirillales bacterium]
MSDSTSRPLEGQAAIVTGSARNIGRAIALALSGAGADVVVHARKDSEGVDETVALIEKAGGRAVACMADITKEDEATGLIAAGVKAFSRLDILVNNAALRIHTPLTEIAMSEWDQVHNVILRAPFMTARAAVPHMRKIGSGRIINLGGLSAHLGSKARPHVIAAKMGVVGLTRALAYELGHDGITANCVVPGLIDTTRGDSAGVHSIAEDPTAPVPRKGKPEEVAAMIRHLCLPESAYITGQTIHVNGGRFMT